MRDSSELSGISDKCFVPELREKATNPRAMRPCFHHHACCGILLREPSQALTVVADNTLFERGARLINDADGVRLIAIIIQPQAAMPMVV